MNSNGPTPEFRDLVAQLCDGELLPQQSQRLEEIATADAESMRYYLQYLDLHGTMRRYATADSPRLAAPLSDLGGQVESPLGSASTSFGQPQSSSHWPWFAGGALLAFGFCLVVFLAFKPAGQIDTAQERRSSPPALQVERAVAYLTMDNGAVWGGDRLAIRNVGSAVQLGDEIALNEGIAEFRLSSGVYLSLEGPASVVLASPSTLVLQYGKLTAHVPWTVTDFKAITSACRVTACDAEFGLSYEGSKIEVHTFSGEVQVEGPNAIHESAVGEGSDAGSVVVDAGIFAKATVGNGISLALIADGEVLKVLNSGRKAASEKFATKLPMAGALAATKSYVDAVLASKPIGYWRFESVSDGSVANEVEGGSKLKIGDNFRFAGHRENLSLEFQPGSKCYLVSDPLSKLGGKEFSVEVWIKPSHLHQGGTLALVTDEPAENHALYLELIGSRNQPGPYSTYPFNRTNPGTIRLLHRDPPGSAGGLSVISSQPYRLRRWQHIVVVKDREKLSLYVDGQYSESRGDAGVLVSGLRLVVGQLETFSNGRKFVGQLDEVAIYCHALTREEIKRHYEAVHWNPDKKESKVRDHSI